MTGPAATPESYREWVAVRDLAVWGPDGVASLRQTAWLDSVPRAVAGAPGAWRAEGGLVAGADVASAGFGTLAPGESLVLEGLRLVAFARDGRLALRVFDASPAGSAPPHPTSASIARYPYTAEAVVEGRYRRSDIGPRSTLSVDGHSSTTTYSGVIKLEFRGQRLELLVADEGETLFAAFADAGSAARPPGFRMIRVDLPAADGIVVVDLNRAYLPPSTFSPHYVCVRPPAENVWSIAVDAGEIAAGTTPTAGSDAT